MKSRWEHETRGAGQSGEGEEAPLLYQAPYWIVSGGEVDGEESPLLLPCEANEYILKKLLRELSECYLDFLIRSKVRIAAQRIRAF